MTTFEDGPAIGKTLMLRRAPLFLRVVVNENTGEVDALDQPDDSPRLDEVLYAYVLTEAPHWAHFRAAKGRGGFFNGGKYKLVQPQPSMEKMAGKTLWARWCEREAIVPEFATEAVKRGSWA